MALSPIAHAESVGDALQACSEESNSLKRLVCFDRIAKNLRQYDGLDEVASQRLPITPPRPESPPRPVADGRTPVKSDSNTEEENFGLKKETGIIRDAVLIDGKLIATVTAIKETPSRKHRFTLNNGQVWEQIETERKGLPVVGETIEIATGLFDSFFLSKPDSNRRFRVKRIQ